MLSVCYKAEEALGCKAVVYNGIMSAVLHSHTELGALGIFSLYHQQGWKIFLKYLVK